MFFLSPRRALLFGIPAIFLAAGAATAGWLTRPAPADLDGSLAKSTEAGLYLAEIAPEAEPVTLGAMHAWTVSLRTADGAPVDQAEIAVDGGMPRHGHGLPTSPVVTRSLARRPAPARRQGGRRQPRAHVVRRRPALQRGRGRRGHRAPFDRRPHV
jgi:hypothetical protein